MSYLTSSIIAASAGRMIYHSVDKPSIIAVAIAGVAALIVTRGSGHPRLVKAGTYVLVGLAGLAVVLYVVSLR